MKYAQWVLFNLIIVSLLFAGGNKQLTLEDIFKSGKFRGERLDSPTWMSDSKAFIFLKKEKGAKRKSFYKHDVATGADNKWIDAGEFIHPETKDTLTFSSFKISSSSKKIIFQTDAKRVWRRFDDGKFFVYDLESKKMLPVAQNDAYIRHVKLSPDESKIGYVLNGNIYIKDLNTGETIAATTDGNGTIINGMSDWVYEEEFGKGDRWSWSMDGQYIAFHQFDQSPIKTFSWVEYDEIDIKVRTVPYPKAGDPNSFVKIGTYELATGNTKWMDIGQESDIYIPRIRWTNDPNTLLIERMNRRQNKLEFLAADAKSGKTKVKFTETDPAWISITDDIFFLKKSNGFIRTSESGGYNHIYRYDFKSGKKSQITKGKWEVAKVYGINEETGRIYFQANKGLMQERHIFSIGLNGKKMQKLSTEPGTHSANFAADFSVYIEQFSNSHIPTRALLTKNDGTNIRTLIENKMESLDDYDLAYPEFTSFKTSDGIELKAMITKPADFDPDKKYPVLIYGYSGPASQLVRNTWGRPSSKLWYTMLTQKGYIIFTLDQRGTGGRGKDFKNLAYGDIGKYMHLDHIEGVKYLRSLPYVDAERIGIWGWSGGGYLTLMEMTRGSEYFKAGIAVAPVTDYHLYDNIWTERYMGLPSENVEGYKAANVITYTDQYKGGLLVIHGASDDNVHMQNTMQFIEQLQQDSKQFDLMIYPGKNHSMRGKGNVSYHLYTLMTHFILENL